MAEDVFATCDWSSLNDDLRTELELLQSMYSAADGSATGVQSVQTYEDGEVEISMHVVSACNMLSAMLHLRMNRSYPTGSGSLSLRITNSKGIDGAETAQLLQKAQDEGMVPGECCLWQVINCVQGLCDSLEEKAECIICLQRLRSGSANDGELFNIDTCAHTLHSACIWPWIRQQALEYQLTEAWTQPRRALRECITNAKIALDDARRSVEHHHRHRNELQVRIRAVQTDMDAGTVDVVAGEQRIKEIEAAIKRWNHSGEPLFAKLQRSTEELARLETSAAGFAGGLDNAAPTTEESWTVLLSQTPLVCPTCRSPFLLSPTQLNSICSNINLATGEWKTATTVATTKPRERGDADVLSDPTVAAYLRSIAAQFARLSMSRGATAAS